MKRILILVSFFCLGITLMASPVDFQQARKVAQHFIARHWCGQSDLQLVETNALSGCNNLFVFNVSDNQGFIIVAADDCAKPILGYATKGACVAGNLSPEFQYWLQYYDRQIAWAKQMRVSAVQTQRAWQELLDDKAFVASKFATEVEPMLTTTWNQRPYYNAHCPVDSALYTSHPTTGCTATGMAQIMKYWNYPTHGYGSYSYSWEGVQPYWTYGTLTADFENTTYQWGNMPDDLNEFSTQDQIDAVAELMFHVGVSIQMSYNLYGEGSSDAPIALLEFTDSMYLDHTYCPENALPTFFGYKNTLRGVLRDGYSDTEWDDMLRNDIDSGRPVLYGGFGIDPNTGATNGGHCFVLDGYDAEGLFHINWGWGGYCDGYFPTSALEVDYYSFSDRQEALLGIEPNYESIGIQDVKCEEVIIYTQSHRIVIRDEQQLPISVFDALGRQIYQNRTPQNETQVAVAADGLYLVRVGQTTRKVVVTR